MPPLPVLEAPTLMAEVAGAIPLCKVSKCAAVAARIPALSRGTSRTRPLEIRMPRSASIASLMRRACKKKVRVDGTEKVYEGVNAPHRRHWSRITSLGARSQCLPVAVPSHCADVGVLSHPPSAEVRVATQRHLGPDTGNDVPTREIEGKIKLHKNAPVLRWRGALNSAGGYFENKTLHSPGWSRHPYPFFCTFSVHLGRNGTPLLSTASVFVTAALPVAACPESSVLPQVHRPELAANGCRSQRGGEILTKAMERALPRGCS